MTAAGSHHESAFERRKAKLHWRRLLWIGAVILCLALRAGPALTESPVGATQPHPNLLFIVVDTLRKDHLGCYGYDRPTSPVIDELASTGIRFETAYSVAPWTLPAGATLLSGLYPSSHTAIESDRILPLAVETLAERLKANGYQTGSFVSHIYMAKNYEMFQGVDKFKVRYGRSTRYVSTENVVTDALDYIKRVSPSSAPFFTLVHLFDPHYEYVRHEEFGFAPESAGRLSGEISIDDLEAKQESLTPEEIALAEAIYDEEIAFTDAGIGRLLEGLDELGVGDETLVVFVADHGEEFLDHGRLGHAHTLYDELLRVPLIIRLPGGEHGGQVIAEPTSTIHVYPTILDLLGLEPSDGVQGQSWAGRIRGESNDASRPADEAAEPSSWNRTQGPTDRGLTAPLFGAAFAEVDSELMSAHLRTLRRGDLKLILDLDTGRTMLFDLATDPGETHDLAAERPDDVVTLREELKAMVSLSRSRETEAGAAVLTQEERDLLRSLGYTN
ncbi:MAG: sulfatase [Candidatus Eisenbacteria bacterium]